MAYEITLGTLTAAQKTDVADLLQKLEALEAAIIQVNTERNAYTDTINAKTRAIETEKAKIKAALQSLRTAEMKEV